MLKKTILCLHCQPKNNILHKTFINVKKILSHLNLLPNKTKLTLRTTREYKMLYIKNIKNLTATIETLHFKFFVTLLTLTCSLNAYEIRFDKSFEKSIEANILSTQVSIKSEKEKELQVKNELDKFIVFFEKLKNVKLKKARLSISPKYKYEKDDVKCVAYYGEIFYQVDAKSSKDMNEFINKFLSFKEKINPKIKIELSSIHWEIDKNNHKKTINELRLKALLWIKKYIIELGKNIDAKCKLKEVDFKQTHRYFEKNMPTYKQKNFSSLTDTYLAKSKEYVSINSNFIIECK